MGLNEERCPKCFSKFGTWQDDPTLTHNGAKFIYDESSGLLIPQSIENRKYKGFYQIKSAVIVELQQNRIQAEEDAGIGDAEKTQFSTVESDENGFWIVNIDIIKELRESTEKIIEAIGTDKETYFNYDEDGNERQSPHQLDWIDPVLDNWKGQIKDQHIEDLRKYLCTEIPVHMLNRGTFSIQTRDGEFIVPICYDDYFYRELGYNSLFVYWWSLRLNELYGSHPEDNYKLTPYPNIYPPTPPGTTWYVFDPPYGEVLRGFKIVERRFFWDTWRYHYTYDGFLQHITCIPKDANLSVMKYYIQEIISTPVLVAETPGWPCQMYVGDTWEYYVTQFKCPQFLEDIIDNLGSAHTIDATVYPATNIFKQDVSPAGGSSGINENAVDTRRIDPLSWGLSYPPSELINPSPGYCNSVGFRGTNPLGNCSIYVPKNYIGNGYKKHLQNKQLSWTFTDDDGDGTIYYGTRTHFLIDITGEDFEEDVYDPSTETFVSRHFGGNTLIAKRNDTDFIAGVIVARNYEELTQVMTSGVNTITLPENTIDRSVKVKFGDTFWRRVSSFDSCVPTDKVFMVSANTVSFGDGTHGMLPTPGETATYQVYENEISYTTYYSGGYIAIAYDESLIDQTVYVYVDYYEAIWSYFEISSPETLHIMNYLFNDKSHTDHIPGVTPSGTYPPGYETSAPAPDSVSAGNILPEQTPEAVKRLHP